MTDRVPQFLLLPRAFQLECYNPKNPIFLPSGEKSAEEIMPGCLNDPLKQIIDDDIENSR